MRTMAQDAEQGDGSTAAETPGSCPTAVAVLGAPPPNPQQAAGHAETTLSLPSLAETEPCAPAGEPFHSHPGAHELRALEQRACACGQPASERDGRCDSCWERHMTLVADAREEADSC